VLVHLIDSNDNNEIEGGLGFFQNYALKYEDAKKQ